MGGSKEIVWSRYKRSDAHMNSQRPCNTYKTCKVSKQTNLRNKKKNWLLSPILTKKLFSGKGKMHFLQWIVMEYINHNPVQPPCTEVICQHKTNSVFFFCCPIISVFLYLFLFLFREVFLRKKENKVE